MTAVTPPSRLARLARATATLLTTAGAIVLIHILGLNLFGAIGLPPLAVDLLTAAALLGGYRLLVSSLQHRNVDELARDRAGRELSVGLAIGGALFTVTAGLLWLLGTFHVAAGTDLPAVGRAVGTALVAGVFEELLIRGLLFRALENRCGSVWALGVSAVVFGVLHLFNPGADLVSGLAIALESGVLLGAAYVATRRLWLALGIHIAWDATESALFGSPDSGEKISGLLHSYLTGPRILDGGPFGVEGSVIAVATCLTVSTVLLLIAQSRGHLVPRPSGRAQCLRGVGNRQEARACSR